VENSPPTGRTTGFRSILSSWKGRLGLIAFVWGVLTTGLMIASTQWSDDAPANRPIKVLAADYVSANSCRSCHPGNYASWHASFHRTMTQVAVPANFAAEMDGLDLTIGGTDYHVERKGKAYYVRGKPHGGSAASFGKQQEIVLLTGSHHLQVYWTDTGAGRALAQLPFAYVIAEKKWVPMGDTFLQPPGRADGDARGYWNLGCIKCHTTQGRPRPGANGQFDTQVSDFGIACEACHGEGREHIERNRNPLRRFALHWSGDPDPTIANPARMDGPTASLVCGQCHGVLDYKSTEDLATWTHTGEKFRPGHKDLDLSWVVQKYGEDHARLRQDLLQAEPHIFDDSYWGDGMVRVTGREVNNVMSSPCYKGGKFSCLSCHELHPAKTDAASLEAWRTTSQMNPGMDSNQACFQCHQDMAAKLTAHTHHAADSAGSSCYNCHMPHTTYGLLHAIRSHQISSPNVRESTELGRPNACNLCHLDQPLAWTAAKLAEWYGQKAPALSEDDQTLAAGAQWVLKGDAGLRQLVAWSMGWAPAQQASGREWLYPYLIFELNDPYAVTRYGAWKSLQTLPGFEHFEFDYTVDDAKQKEALEQAYEKWVHEVRSPGGYRAQTLLQPDGGFWQEQFDRLLSGRNNRSVFLVE
jgi:hypothetical protein